MLKPNEELEGGLSRLQAGEFIYEQPATGDAEYIFKHALTQEVAYNALLIERRKLLHERAGQALESMYAEQLDDHLVRLAHHFSHSDNIEKAVAYLELAAQQAVQRSSYAEAVTHLTSALELLSTFPNTLERSQHELRLQVILGVPLGILKGHVAPEWEPFIAGRAIYADKWGTLRCPLRATVVLSCTGGLPRSA